MGREFIYLAAHIPLHTKDSLILFQTELYCLLQEGIIAQDWQNLPQLPKNSQNIKGFII